MIGTPPKESLISVEDALKNNSSPHFHTLLTREFYVSEDVYKEEQRKVFPRVWAFGGHISQIPQIGDYFTVDYAGESVVIVRVSADKVCGLLNVCRHRGHKLCPSEVGNVRKFTCPYHHWTYGLEGNLRNVQGVKDGEVFSYEDWGLWKVQIESYHGFLFFCTGNEAIGSLSEKFTSIESELAQLDLTNLKEASREPYRINANWKTMFENYLECYHCHAGHVTLCETADLQGMFSKTDEWQDPYFTGKVPLKSGMKTLSIDGNLVAPPLGVFKNMQDIPDNFGTGFGILPALTRVIMHIDHVVVHTLRPIAVNKVEWETRWYVRSDAVEGIDYNLNNLKKPWAVTNSEDKSFCESAYSGVQSQRFTPGPLDIIKESAIPAAHRAYMDLMNA